MNVVPSTWDADHPPSLGSPRLKYCAIKMSFVTGAQVYRHIFLRVRQPARAQSTLGIEIFQPFCRMDDLVDHSAEWLITSTILQNG